MPELSPELRSLLERVTEDFGKAEEDHRSRREGWDKLYALYRSYQSFRRDYESEPDRQEVLHEGQQRWGAELFIPYAFATVETILPRVLSNRPRMNVLPRNKASEDNVANMKNTVEAQQERMRYELKLQETAKSGLIYGLGVSKGPIWRRDVRQLPVLEKGINNPWVESEPRERVMWDDPDVEDVDIFDFFWDPAGYTIETCEFIVHRTWRTRRYVERKLQSEEWDNPGDVPLEELVELSSGKYDESTAERFRSAGQRSNVRRGENLHEVWEYHDGEQVITVLDREVPVNLADNPAWHGEMPFHAYRPTTSGLKELPGIGEIEPIEHLQREMNTLRSQRRDNAALKLQQVFAYADGMVDQDDLQFFPGAGIPTIGDPREMLFPINVGDIPNSGYQEEAGLKGDIEMTTGISDPVAGTGDASQTATGVQLVQAAANVRIQMKTQRIELEVVGPQAHQTVLLNQQRIVSNRDIRVPSQPTPQEPNRRWAWATYGPTELAGEFDILPIGGSMAPDNVPQDRADAQTLLNAFSGNPEIDQRVMLGEALKKLGVKNPEGWLAPDQRVPPVLLDLLVQGGFPKDQLAQLYDQAVQMEQQQQGQSPNAQQSPQEASQSPGQEQGGQEGGSNGSAPQTAAQG